MDSFYDAPRRAPPPVASERIATSPVVPEVSMLCQNKTPILNKFVPYNAWKNSTGDHNFVANKENICRSNFLPQRPENSSILKKQVRFESPILQQRPSLTYEPFVAKKITNPQESVSHTPKPTTSENKHITPLNGKTFEQIYMANIPNRHLDLSIIEHKQPAPQIFDENKKQCDVINVKNDTNNVFNKNSTNESEDLPKTYKEFLEKHNIIERDTKNCVTDILNYRRTSSCPQELDKNNYATKPTAPQLNRNVPNMASNYDFHKHNQMEEGNGRILSNIPQPNTRECNVNQMLPNNANQEYQKYSNYVNPYDALRQNSNNNLDSHKQKNNVVTQTSQVYSSQPAEQKETSSKDDEPSVKDLLKIISQQNEQLLLLQKQVATLMNRDSNVRQIEAPPAIQKNNNEKYVTSTQCETYNHRNPMMHDVKTTPRKGPKFSIDLMTSFEVSFRPHQQNKNKEFMNYEPKIQEITEIESCNNETNVDVNNKNPLEGSLHLQEPVNVRESCPSPDPSIKINMNDYDSSDDEDSTSEIRETFYRNLMGQVNNILHKAQLQSSEEMRTKQQNGTDFEKTRDKTMSRVKEATLRHLKSIGVNLPDIEDETTDSMRANDSKDYSPTEISFAVKQMLMKYLPDDHLTKITYKQCVPFTAEDRQTGLINARPEFSFATVQYMKKYNLISNGENKSKKALFQPMPPKLSRPQNGEPKILDISALKLQPKLL